MAWIDAELEFIRALREGRNCQSWLEIAKQASKKFKRHITGDAASTAYRRYADLGATDDTDMTTRSIKQLRRARRTSSYNARSTRLLADQQEIEGEVVERIQAIANRLQARKPRITKIRRHPKRLNMVMELLLSDIHMGRLVRREEHVIYNEAIARSRMKEMTRVVLKELHINKTHYNVNRLVIAMLGDMIESYTMHGIESSKTCEFGTARQVWAVIDALLFNVFIPLAETGLQIDVPAVTGNHDRSEMKRTFVNPGENNWSWVIYKSLEALLKSRGYTNVKFYIPIGPYVVLDIYGNKVLYEHCDNIKGGVGSRGAFETLIAQRTQQEGVVIDFLRGGHYHELHQYGNGRIIINMSPSGPDSYAHVKGYHSGPGQVLSSYLDFDMKLEPGQRKNTFHKTFGIKLP